jgi:hypothetical protein
VFISYPSKRVGSPSNGKLLNKHSGTASAARMVLHHDTFQTRRLTVPADVKIYVVVFLLMAPGGLALGINTVDRYYYWLIFIPFYFG